MKTKTLTLKRVMLAALLLATVLLVKECFFDKRLNWREEVQLASGEVIQVRRTLIARVIADFGPSAGAWTNQGGTLEIIQPKDPSNPAIWRAKIKPILFDRDASGHWVVVAMVPTCNIWHEVGKPDLPYVEFAYLNGQWVQRPLSAEFKGRMANMFTNMANTGKTRDIRYDYGILLELADKEKLMGNPKLLKRAKSILHEAPEFSASPEGCANTAPPRLNPKEKTHDYPTNH